MINFKFRVGQDCYFSAYGKTNAYGVVLRRYEQAGSPMYEITSQRKCFVVDQWSMKPNYEKLIDVSIEGIDHRDCPDYCDAYASEGFWQDGREMTPKELDAFTDSESFRDYLECWMH